MCVIVNVIGPDHPSLEMLQQCHESNSYGAGIAWVNKKKKVQFIKQLKNADEVVKVIEKYHIQPPYVVHFRIPSVGGSDTRLTHPFVISGDADYSSEGEADKVLFHNGTWHMWDEKIIQLCMNRGMDLPVGPWSDSRAMAWLMHHTGINALELMLRGQQRVAVFDRYGADCLGGWHEQKKEGKGIWTSNDHWQRKVTVVHRPPQQQQPTYSVSKDSQGNVVKTYLTDFKPDDQEADTTPATTIGYGSTGGALDIESWNNLTDTTRHALASSTKMPLCTKTSCLIDLTHTPNDGDYCGKCKKNREHWSGCIELQEWVQERLDQNKPSEPKVLGPKTPVEIASEMLEKITVN